MTFDNVRNYYEELVFKEVSRALGEQQRQNDEDFAEDVACVALNNLQPRYVHHNVYLAFYLSAEDRKEMEETIRNAVADAIDYVSKHGR